MARQAPRSPGQQVSEDLKTLGVSISISGESPGGQVLADKVNEMLPGVLSTAISGGGLPSLATLGAAIGPALLIAGALELAGRINDYEQMKRDHFELGPGKDGYYTSIPYQIRTEYVRLRSQLEVYVRNAPTLTTIINAIDLTRYQIWDMEALNVPISHTTGSPATKNIVYAHDVRRDVPYMRPGYIATGHYGYLVELPSKHWSKKKPPDILNKSRRINIRDRWEIPTKSELLHYLTDSEYQDMAEILRDLYFYNTPLVNYQRGIAYLQSAEQGINVGGGNSIGIMKNLALPAFQAVIPEFVRFNKVTQILQNVDNRLSPPSEKLLSENTRSIEQNKQNRAQYLTGIPFIDWLIIHF